MASSCVRLVWNRSDTQAELQSELVPLSDGDPRYRFVWGDNLSALKLLNSELAGQVTLAYLDPPFLSNKQYQHVTRQRDANGVITRTRHPAFDDRWQSLGAYLDALRARLVLVYSTLSAHGSVVIHVDPKTSHYVKVLCDELFGIECFSSEIIWRYRRWPSKTPNFQRVHDVLLRYVKDPQAKPRFNQLYESLAPSTVATWGNKRQRAVVGDDGRRVRSSKTPQASPGSPLGDVWEISIVAPVARERTGYPTQKPEALLERLIRALSDPGDLILDPYAGSGTTLAVAARLGRHAVGIDQGRDALDVTRQRLNGQQVTLLEQQVAATVSRVVRTQ